MMQEGQSSRDAINIAGIAEHIAPMSQPQTEEPKSAGYFYEMMGLPPPLPIDTDEYRRLTAIISSNTIDSQIAKALGLAPGKRYLIALLGEAPPIK